MGSNISIDEIYIFEREAKYLEIKSYLKGKL